MEDMISRAVSYGVLTKVQTDGGLAMEDMYILKQIYYDRKMEEKNRLTTL